MALSEDQRRVRSGMAAGMAATIGALGAALAVPPMRAVTHGGVFARLDFWAGWALPVVLVLLLIIALVALQGYMRAGESGGAAGHAEYVAMLRDVLQDTVEQTVLWLAVTLVWAIRMPVATLGAVPVAAVLFVVGRALFLRGYRGGAAKRSLGFAMTFHPPLVMALVLVLEGLGVPFD